MLSTQRSLLLSLLISPRRLMMRKIRWGPKKGKARKTKITFQTRFSVFCKDRKFATEIPTHEKSFGKLYTHFSKAFCTGKKPFGLKRRRNAGWSLQNATFGTNGEKIYAFFGKSKKSFQIIQSNKWINTPESWNPLQKDINFNEAK